MAQIKKLGLPTKERKALLRNQASYLLWHGKLETTLVKAKSVSSYAEKVLTLAINTYEDTVKTTKTVVNSKGEKVSREVIVDGAKKLAARRKIMSLIYDIPETKQPKESKTAFVERTKDVKHPLVEKIFNVYAPKFDARSKELGQKGGYTRVIKLGKRLGDNADMARVELVK